MFKAYNYPSPRPTSTQIGFGDEVDNFERCSFNQNRYVGVDRGVIVALNGKHQSPPQKPSPQKTNETSFHQKTQSLDVF